MNDIIGNIHSIETCGTVDGPGIRYVVFTQGCPLRCIFCHNPDTWTQNSANRIIMSVSELMADINKYKSYFRFSGGGVTLTGGEPLMQSEFGAALFEECQKEGLHTTLDTSGYCDIDSDVENLLDHTDLVLLDIKSINAKTYKSITGFPINKTLEFTRYLSAKSIPVWAGFVLVPGLTDKEEELHDLASFLTTLDNVERVRVLPFHQLGAYKWQDLRIKYKLADTPVPSPEETERVRDLFKKYGLFVR